MMHEDEIKYWLKIAAHDLDVAAALFAARKYDWCLFIAHLVLEKTLKDFMCAITARCRHRYINWMFWRHIQN